MMKLHRRQALALLGAGAGVAAADTASAAQTATAAELFRHGVAAGDPARDGFVVWTRISVPAGTAAQTLRWTVFADADLTQAVASGDVEAGPDRDFTAKAEAEGLNAGQDYWYRFELGDAVSPTGRAKTLPAEGDAAPVILAVASCALHPNGYFNAYQAIADLEQVDAVVHLGDYIYEYSAEPTAYGMRNGVRLNRIPEPAHEIVTLADYRQRHAQYKTEAPLQAAHARAAWIVVYDDHEVTNDAWVDGAENHQPETEGDWASRKAAALRAWFEWMPIREPRPGQPMLESIQRSFQFGRVAALHMVESRLTARSLQLEYEDLMAADGSVDRTRLNADDREMLGAAQLASLGQRMRNDATWQVLGNQVVMARVTVPDVRRLVGDEMLNTALAGITDDYARRRLQQMVQLGAAGVPMNLDAWDGYPAERERLYAVAREAEARLVVLAGDSHSGWANQLADADGAMRGVEFGCTAISSPSPSYSANLPADMVGQLLRQANPEIKWCDFGPRGFTLVTLTTEAAEGRMIGVSTISEPAFEVTELARLRSVAQPQGQGPLEPVTA